jgi:tetratricopeptide (TPR) repeat protein
MQSAAWREIGNLARDLNHFDQASIAYQRALTLLKFKENSTYEAEILSEMAKLETLKGHYQKAYVLYNQAETIFKNSGADIYIASVMIGIGELEIAKNDYQKASEAYRKAIDFYTTHHDLEGKARALIELAKVEGKTGASEAHIQHLQEANQILKEIGIAKSLSKKEVF